MTLYISKKINVPLNEIEMTAVRAQGAGGQNVNKVASAIHLRFDINASSLPNFYKERLRISKDQRISKEGIIVIKAQRYRNQEKNREDALARLQTLIKRAGVTTKQRKPTKPSQTSKEKRLNRKRQRSDVKKLRGKVKY